MVSTPTAHLSFFFHNTLSLHGAHLPLRSCVEQHSSRHYRYSLDSGSAGRRGEIFIPRKKARHLSRAGTNQLEVGALPFKFYSLGPTSQRFGVADSLYSRVARSTPDYSTGALETTRRANHQQHFIRDCCDSDFGSRSIVSQL